jgi:hypothetical protein
MIRHNPIKAERIEDDATFLNLLLPRPDQIIWPENSADLLQTRQKCQNTLDRDFWPLIDLSILTAGLLKKKSNSLSTSPFFETLCKEFLPELTQEKILQALWKPVPVPGATPMGGGREAGITWYIIGHLQAPPFSSCWPAWAAELMDIDAQAVILDAFSSACHLTGIVEHLYIFPLINRNSGQGKILQGRSSGLPVAIAATELLLGTSKETRYIATGDIVDKEGLTGPVNEQTLAAKAEVAAEAGFSLFLYPQKNAASLTCHIEEIRLQPVNSLQQARLWAECLTTTAMVPDVQRLDTALQSSTDLINNIDNLLPALLEWVHCSNTAANLIEEICNRPDLSWKLSEKLKAILRRNKENLQIPVSISRLIDKEEQINKMGEANPAAALSWCSSHLDLANHKGDNARSRFWWNLGDRYTEKASESEDGRRICGEFFNRFFGIGNRHNQFHFVPDLPQEFTDHLHHLEELHQVACKRGQCSNYLLGSMYGTVGQNYAFCGPDFLDRTIHYLTAAQKAFGPADTKNCQQEDSYLYFAFLDAGPTYATEAIEKFCSALAVSSIREIRYSQLEKYRHFALLRALVEIPDQFSPDMYNHLSDQAYAHFTTVMAEIKKGLHPWQLWCYNLGRLAEQQGKSSLVKQAWQISLNLCERGDETIQIMGLLPLAALWKINCLDNNYYAKIEIILNRIRFSPYIHHTHFQSILDKKSGADVLEFVSKFPNKLFPFNYR